MESLSGDATAHGSRFIRWLFAATEFLCFYLKEVLLSNLRMAYDVLTPPLHMHSQIVHLDLPPDMTDIQIAVLANAITMTPGTLSVDVSGDNRKLYIHAMYVDDVAKIKQEMERNYVLRVCRVF